MVRAGSSARQQAARALACLLALVLLATVALGLAALGRAGGAPLPLAPHALALLAGGSGLALAALLGVGLVHTRRALGAQVAESELRLRLLVEGVEDSALCVLDAQGRVVQWNAGAERISGWARADIEGASWETLHPPEARAAGAAREQLARAAREGRLSGQGWRVRRDGSRYWAQAQLTALRDAQGRVRGWAEVTRDLTERRRMDRAQQLFAEAGRLFQQVHDAEALREALARLCVPEEADACILYARAEDGSATPLALAHAEAPGERAMALLVQPLPAEERFFGPQAVLESGRPELLPRVDAARLAPHVRESAYGALLEALGAQSALTVPLHASGEGLLGALTLVSRQPGRTYSEVDVAFVQEVAGRAALALENAHLLAQAQGALELIGVAAHDLSSPLWTLQLRLHHLRRMAGALPPAQMAEELAGAESQTRALGLLLHNLLDLSRASAGRLELESEPVDLAELVQEVSARFASPAAEAGCALAVHAERALEGHWDRMRLERVLTNLLSNALKYGRGAPVEVRAEARGGLARLSVRDGGPGIPHEAQALLFRRFGRLGGSEQRRAAGFGLGLYIVRQLVEAHGGSVRVESVPGQGAAFIVELPAYGPPALARAEWPQVSA